MRWSRGLSFLKPLLLVGCFSTAPSSGGSCQPLAPAGPAQSRDLATDQLSPSMSAQSYGTGIHVYAAFMSPTELSPGDTFTASENGAPAAELAREAEDAGGGPVHYTTMFPDNAAPADIVIAFDRTGGQVSAPRSEVVVPESFAITSTPPASLAFGDPLPISIAPPPAPLPAQFVDATSITATGTCLTPAQQGLLRVDFDAQGSGAFDTSYLKHGPVAAGGCDVSIEVRHETRGPFDPAFTHPDAGDAGAGALDAAVLAELAEAGLVLALINGGAEGLQSRSFTAHFAR